MSSVILMRIKGLAFQNASTNGHEMNNAGDVDMELPYIKTEGKWMTVGPDPQGNTYDVLESQATLVAVDNIRADVIEEAAIKARENMGAPEFDEIKAVGDQTVCYYKGHVTMIIDMPFEQLTAYIRHNYIR